MYTSKETCRLQLIDLLNIVAVAWWRIFVVVHWSQGEMVSVETMTNLTDSRKNSGVFL